MSAPQIRADHDSLAKISQIFARHGASSQQLHQRIQRQVNTLQGGDWIGKGAKAFYREMDAEVLPSLKQLSAALQAADRVTRKISQIMQDAGEEAAALFRLGLAPGLGLGTLAAGLAAGAADGTGADGSPSLLKSILSAYKDSVPFNVASGVDTLLGLAGTFTKELISKGWSAPKVLDFIANNKYLGAAGKGFAIFGAGVNVGNFVDDPGVQTGADLGASGIGLYGAFAAGPAGAVAGAFAGGYSFGSAFIAPYTTGPLSDALTKWDPLDRGYSPSNYPRSTIRDYELSGKKMSMDVARDVYTGLRKSSSKDAAAFAKNYSESNGMSTGEFYAKSSFFWFR